MKFAALRRSSILKDRDIAKRESREPIGTQEQSVLTPSTAIEVSDLGR